MSTYYSDYITIDELVDDINDLLSHYSDTGKITESNIVKFALDRLRVFGNNVMEEYEDLVEVVNHAGTLPDNLYRLNSIVKCRKCDKPLRPEICKDWTDEEIEKLREKRASLMRRQLYKWVETNKYEEVYNECNDCDREIATTVGGAYELIPDVLKVRISCPELLSFGPGVNKGLCTDSCMGCHNPHSKYHIDVINNRNLRCTFPEATLYINYYGIPIDDDGRPMIKNSSKGYVYENIYYYVAYKILQLIMVVDTSARQLYAEMRQEFKESDRKARVDAKASTFTVDAYIQERNRNRINMERYFDSRPRRHMGLAKNTVGIQPPCETDCYRYKSHS